MFGKFVVGSCLMVGDLVLYCIWVEGIRDILVVLGKMVVVMLLLFLEVIRKKL